MIIGKKMLALIIMGGLLLLLILFLLVRKFLKRLKPEHVKKRWQELQSYLSSKETWPLAIITADKLLDESLKKCHFKGKSMGERMVSAQRSFTDNDSVWYAHNLSKKLIDNSHARLRQADVKKAMFGIRQALRDVGALRDKS